MASAVPTTSLDRAPLTARGARVPDLLTADEYSSLAHTLGLTLRESEVLTAALYDEGRAAVGRRLKMSEQTVHVHFGHIFQKLRVRSVAQAISVAFAAYVELKLVSDLPARAGDTLLALGNTGNGR